MCRTSALWFQVAEEVLRLTDVTRKHFYNGDRVYLEGEEVRFPELADTLQAVGEGGADLFYEGELARKISAYMLKMGGIITEEDLAVYEPVVREPMSVGYGAGAMYTNGPPSAGGGAAAKLEGLSTRATYASNEPPCAGWSALAERGKLFEKV